MRKIIIPAAFCLLCTAANAGPSTQIWIPSTDTQKSKTVHLNIDSYVPAGKNRNGIWKAPLFDLGPLTGFSLSTQISAEAGFDLIRSGMPADSYPLYLNAKAGTREGMLFRNSPAFAIGGYNFGFKKGITDQNIIYGIAARTFAYIGRFSAGWFRGNPRVLTDEDGVRKSSGLLLSWDRVMSGISDKLWAAADYQGGNSALGALNFGFSWSFAPNTSVIFGYDIYNNRNVAGADTFNVQVDINI